ncbi:MAG TPA: UDP-N-acetylmuramoyl-L-alanyl-D-glutamate--2,6-diaminopimelate ligase [Thermodesulfobacteriota bacterium]|nr:UDP-N-acetylmuramoyl-L-alanyl-D-glutamate--2,6-diaminopimelate ligase [Thermodesulfobacteriota bacterium]
MKLREIIRGIKTKKFDGDDRLEISGISIDSNKVKEGYLFAALRGEKTDGHRYIDSALRNGAVALLVEDAPENGYPGITVVRAGDSRESLARAAANYYGHPTKELTLAGVTGTNGKTTVTYLLESIWKEEGRNPGVIGTIEYRYGGSKVEAPMTTPESLDLMRMFREMRDAGVDCAAMEVSSHAIDRKRVLECHFDAAVFTNLTQDHLDYHGTIENYFGAKKRLFTELLSASDKKDKFSVINIDDPFGVEIAKDAPGSLVTYSLRDTSASVSAAGFRVSGEGIRARLSTPWGGAEIESPLFGEHNLSNILAASAAALSLGSSPEAVERAVSGFTAVPGRLERVENPLGFQVLVDYAHTPDALKNVLLAVRPLTAGKLILVFGCGGDRDRTKRPKMGGIGRELSDVLIVTSDNPRTESPEEIIDEIERGVLGPGALDKPYFRITDRKEAIRKAVGIAGKNDTVLIAGKGHEDYQIIGTTKHPFDDRAVTRELLKEKLN